MRTILFAFQQNPEKPQICKNESDKLCYEEVLNQLKSDQNKYCLKSCHAKEFEAADMGRMYPPAGYDRKKLFAFGYKFPLPKSIVNLRHNEPVKTIKEELLIVDTMSLVGNIGGTLGLFVGFSFFGATQWLMESVSNFWMLLTRWIQAFQINKVAQEGSFS